VIEVDTPGAPRPDSLRGSSLIVGTISCLTLSMLLISSLTGVLAANQPSPYYSGMSLKLAQQPVNDSFYFPDLAARSAVRSNITSQPLLLSNSTSGMNSLNRSPPLSDPHWYFGTQADENYPSTNAIFYNFTTPDGFQQSDQVFTGVSSWDSQENYDQMGIVTGSWFVNQNGGSAPCSTSNHWCAYFSTCFAPSNGNYCLSGNAGFQAWEYDLTSSTNYEEEMAIKCQPITHGCAYQLNGYLYYMGTNNAHQLLDSLAYTLSYGVTHFTVQGVYCIASDCFPDFTDYEEVDATNPVEPWPAFNFHTDIAVAGGTQVGWTPVGSLGANEIGFPSQFANLCTTSTYPHYNLLGVCYYTYSGSQNFVNIDNEPFEAWVGNYLGYGVYILTLHCRPTCGFAAMAWIGPIADPTGGYYVSYQYNYCTLPCGYVFFSPSSSPVLPPSDSQGYNAQMGVSGSGENPGTYFMNLYSYDANSTGPSTGTIVPSWQISQWEIVFT
jgi:hypothetical protein